MGGGGKNAEERDEHEAEHEGGRVCMRCERAGSGNEKRAPHDALPDENAKLKQQLADAEEKQKAADEKHAAELAAAQKDSEEKVTAAQKDADEKHAQELANTKAEHEKERDTMRSELTGSADEKAAALIHRPLGRDVLIGWIA